MNYIDLHFHSNYSDDGEFTPEELIALCKKNKLTLVSLTDHNTTRGVEEASQAAIAANIRFIPGVELDCTCQGVGLHILGYWIDPKHPGFAKIEQNILEQEQASAQKRLQLVQALGIYVDSEILKFSKNGVLTGEAIAQAALVQKENDDNLLLRPYRMGGSRADNAPVNFYWDYCAQGKAAYVPIIYPDLSETVKLINDSGGFAILAHPGNNVREDRLLLEEILRYNIVGIEVYSSYHSKEQTAYYLQQAIGRNLTVTCGSDFHGKIKPSIKLGSVTCDGQEDMIFKSMF